MIPYGTMTLLLIRASLIAITTTDIILEQSIGFCFRNETKSFDDNKYHGVLMCLFDTDYRRRILVIIIDIIINYRQHFEVSLTATKSTTNIEPNLTSEIKSTDLYVKNLQKLFSFHSHFLRCHLVLDDVEDDTIVMNDRRFLWHLYRDSSMLRQVLFSVKKPPPPPATKRDLALPLSFYQVEKN
ncbi:hypothetical protein NH340_JMT02147 [Sarcoptes scabiei]|nr:hypothetical protein NH340_JMT02147 [Sarcoptes scabiei]